MAASIALHVAILLVLPTMRLAERSPAEALNVTLQRVEPPRVVPAPEPTPPPPKKVPPKRAQRDEVVKAPAPVRPAAPEPARPTTPEAVRPAAPEPLRVAPAPAPVLTMPETPTAGAPSVPQPETPGGAAAGRHGGEREQAARAAPRADKSAEITPAKVLHAPKPAYPYSARRRGLEGTVVLHIVVTPEGLPGRITVDKSSGAEALDSFAVEHVRRTWRFVPARKGGQPIEASVLLPMVFKLTDGF